MKLQDKIEIDYLKRPIVLLHWLLFIMVVFFVFYTVKESRINFITACFTSLILFFIFNIILTILPANIIEKQISYYIIFFFDVIIISLNVYFTQGFDTDLYLTYFLIIFIAGIGQNIAGSILTAVIASVLYGFILFKGNTLTSPIDPALLMRIPFLFVISLVSSFFSEETKKYKKQVEEAKKIRMELKEHIRLTATELLNKNEELKNIDEDLKVRITESEVLIATLKESEEKYRNIFENSDNIIFTLSMDGKITTINKRTKDIIGYSDIDCLGQIFSSFVLEKDLEKFTDTLHSVSVRENKHLKVTLNVKHINGSSASLSINLFPVHYSGEVICIQGIAKQI